MPMPVQISLEEVLSMLLSRVELLSVNEENSKTRFNVLARALYKKGILNDEDILSAVKDEYKMLKELGLIGEEPAEEVTQALADSILQWIKGDVEAIKKSMEEYEKRLREYSTQETSRSNITVAPSSVLQQLDKLGGPAKKPGGGKLII